MASFETILRVDDKNAFRAPEKLQPKMGRKPLTDMTNSRKRFAKNKASVEILSAFKAPEKVVQPKAGRKPLGDLTNSKQPRAQEVSSRKSHSFVFEEGFLHNHDECIKANQQASAMSMEYFLKTVGLNRDSSSLKITPQLPCLSKPSELELEADLVIEEIEMDFSDICASPPPAPTPSTPRCPGSPIWDIENMEFSPLKLKDSNQGLVSFHLGQVDCSSPLTGSLA